MAGMILLSFVIGFPIFLVMIWVLVKVLFTPLDLLDAQQQNEKKMLLQRAKRVRRKDRVKQAQPQREVRPVFTLRQLNVQNR
jgi:hypothetical protein